MLRSSAGGEAQSSERVASRLASMLHWLTGTPGQGPRGSPVWRRRKATLSVNLEKCPLGLPGQRPCLCFFILKFRDYIRDLEAAGWDVSNNVDVLHN